MAHLIEYRKVNDTYFPMHFKFATITPKHNLTSDKYISIENWMFIFDQLDEILAGEASSSKKSKTFEHGRVSVKAKWIKTTDSNGIGQHISKILNTNSTPPNVGKHFLKIDVKLNSDFDHIVKELEKELKHLKEKNKILESNHSDTSSVKHQNGSMSNEVKTEVKAELLVPKKEKRDSSSLSQSTADYNGYEDFNTSVEEYIPPFRTPCTAPPYHPTESVPTYNPEKNSAQIEMNQIQSEYSPTFLNAVVPENVSYRPSTSNRPVDNEDVKKSAKKSRLRVRSISLFGTSDEDDSDIVNKVSSSSHHKSKRKKETSSRKDTQSNRDTPRSKKKKSSDSQRSQDSVTELSDISLRNLMNEPIDVILDTYPDHEEHLTELYRTHIKVLKRNYRPKDIPELVAHDLVTPLQFQAMVALLEKKLVRNLEEEHNSSDVIFDVILPEWAFRIYCSKFQYTRSEALENLHQQAIALSNRSDSQLF